MPVIDDSDKQPAQRARRWTGRREGQFGEILWSRTDDYMFLFNLKRMALWRVIKKRPRALDPNGRWWF